MRKYDPVELMRQFLFLRESGGQNRGARIEAIQRWCNGSPGESWCCYLVTMCLDISYQGNSPIPRMGSCQGVYDLAKKNGWMVTDAKYGDIYLYVDENGHAHHIGFVTKDGGTPGIAGNTSEDGKSSNGDRVAEHDISTNKDRVKYIRIPL